MGESEMMKEEGRKKLKVGQGRRDRMQENDMPTRVVVVGFYVHMRTYYVHPQSTPLPLTRVIVVENWVSKSGRDIHRPFYL